MTNESSLHSRVHEAVSSAQAKWNVNGAGLSGALLYYRIAGNLREFCTPQIFVRGTRKCVGGNPKKKFVTGKACGRQSMEVLFAKCSIFNQFRKFSYAKVPKYSIDKVIVRVTTPTHHSHKPLGMQFLV